MKKNPISYWSSRKILETRGKMNHYQLINLQPSKSRDHLVSSQTCETRAKMLKSVEMTAMSKRSQSLRTSEWQQTREVTIKILSLKIERLTTYEREVHPQKQVEKKRKGESRISGKMEIIGAKKKNSAWEF